MVPGVNAVSALPYHFQRPNKNPQFIYMGTPRQAKLSRLTSSTRCAQMPLTTMARLGVRIEYGLEEVGDVTDESAGATASLVEGITDITALQL